MNVQDSNSRFLEQGTLFIRPQLCLPSSYVTFSPFLSSRILSWKEVEPDFFVELLRDGWEDNLGHWMDEQEELESVQ